MNLKGFGREMSWPNRGTILAVLWTDWRKPQK